MEGKSKIILAEKPIAGNKIQDALGIAAIPAVGHLIELKPKARKWTPPYFDLQWVVRKKEADRLSKIVRHLKDADEIYIATPSHSRTPIPFSRLHTVQRCFFNLFFFSFTKIIGSQWSTKIIIVGDEAVQ